VSPAVAGLAARGPRQANVIVDVGGAAIWGIKTGLGLWQWCSPCPLHAVPVPFSSQYWVWCDKPGRGLGGCLRSSRRTVVRIKEFDRPFRRVRQDDLRADHLPVDDAEAP